MLAEKLDKCGYQINVGGIEIPKQEFYIDSRINIDNYGPKLRILYIKNNEVYRRNANGEQNVKFYAPNEGIMLISNIDFAAKILAQILQKDMRELYFALKKLSKNSKCTRAVYSEANGMTFYVAFDFALLAKEFF